MGFKTSPPKQKSLEVIPVEELERVTSEEVNGVMNAFEQRAQDENARLLDATDSEFWFSVCFQTRAQKEEFLKK